MRILFAYENGCGGETTATNNLIEEIKHRPDLTTETIILNNLRKTSTFYYFGWLFSSIFRSIVGILKAKDTTDCIYYSTFTAGVVAETFKKFKKFKTVFHYHGNRIPDNCGINVNIFSTITQKIKYLIAINLHRYITMRTDVIIVPSKSTKKYLRNTFSLGNKDVCIVKNGVNPGIFHPVNEKKIEVLRSKYNISNKTKVIVSSGRLDTKKRVGDLVSIYPRILPSIPDSKLFIIFPTPITNSETKCYRELLNMIRDRKLINNIILIENAIVYEILQISDLEVSLSSEENMSLSMLEAIACGLPYLHNNKNSAEITSKIDERLFINEKTDDIAKKIIEFLKLNENVLLRLRKQMKLIIEDYSWDSAASRVIKIISDLTT